MGQGGALRVLRPAALVALVLAALLGPPATGAAAEPGWQPPLDLGPGYLYSNPQVAGDGAGGTLIARQESTGDNGRYTIHVADVPNAGAPVAEQTLGGLTSARGASLSSNRRGDAIVAWNETSKNCCTTLSAATRAPGEPFGSTQAVTYGTGFVSEVHTAINDAGEAVIVYALDETDNSAQLWAVFRDAGGNYSAPVAVSPRVDHGNLFEFSVALADDGTAIVAWPAPLPSNWCDGSGCGSTNPPQVISVATGGPSGFSSPAVVSDQSVPSYEPRLAIDPAGDAVLAWYGIVSHQDGSQTVYTMAATRRAGGQFGPGHLLATGPYQSWVDAALGDDGRGLIAFAAGSGSTLETATVDAPSGAFGSAVPMVDGVAFSRVAVAPDGIALIAWETPIDISQQPYAAATYVAWGGVGGSFGATRTLTCPEPYYSLLDASLAPDARNASVLLLDRGPTVSDSDDRVALARTSTEVPPDGTPCPGHPSGRIEASTDTGKPGAGGAPPASAPQTTSPSGSSGRPARVRLRGRLLTCRGTRRRRCRRLASPLTVTVLDRRGRRVATQRARHGRFSFLLGPGRYTLRAGGRSRRVLLRRRASASVDLVVRGR